MIIDRHGYYFLQHKDMLQLMLDATSEEEEETTDGVSDGNNDSRTSCPAQKKGGVLTDKGSCDACHHDNDSWI